MIRSNLILLSVLILLSGCADGGVMNITKLPISDETVTALSGDITDTSVQKEALFFKAHEARDKAYKSMYAQSGFSVEFEMKEISPGVFVQLMKKVSFREAPKFSDPLPHGPSIHPGWATANNFIDKGFNALLWWTGITQGVDLLKNAQNRSAPQYYGNYNSQTAEPYTVRPEVILVQ